jgi:hypothetical protein
MDTSVGNNYVLLCKGEQVDVNIGSGALTPSPTKGNTCFDLGAGQEAARAVIGLPHGMILTRSLKTLSSRRTASGRTVGKQLKISLSWYADTEAVYFRARHTTSPPVPCPSPVVVLK